MSVSPVKRDETVLFALSYDKCGWCLALLKSNVKLPCPTRVYYTTIMYNCDQPYNMKVFYQASESLV